MNPVNNNDPQINDINHTLSTDKSSTIDLLNKTNEELANDKKTKDAFDGLEHAVQNLDKTTKHTITNLAKTTVENSESHTPNDDSIDKNNFQQFNEENVSLNTLENNRLEENQPDSLEESQLSEFEDSFENINNDLSDYEDNDSYTNHAIRTLKNSNAMISDEIQQVFFTESLTKEINQNISLLCNAKCCDRDIESHLSHTVTNKTVTLANGKDYILYPVHIKKRRPLGLSIFSFSFLKNFFNLNFFKWTLGRDHSSFIAVNLSDNCIEYYDPKGKKATEKREYEFVGISSYTVDDMIKELGEKHLNSEKPITVVSSEQKHQSSRDRVNCGVYTTTAIYELATKADVNFNTISSASKSKITSQEMRNNLIKIMNKETNTVNAF